MLSGIFWAVLAAASPGSDGGGDVDTGDAILLLGGDKASDSKFYARIIPRVEGIWREYLLEQKGKRGKE